MIIRVNKKIIKSLNPCADRYKNYLNHYSDFDGTLEEFLYLEHISHSDKIWLSVRRMPRFLVEVFAIDCAVRSADYAYYAAADYADSAAYAADYADYAADSAAYAAAYAAAGYAAAAYAADYAAAYVDERQNQIESIIYLIQSEG